MKLKQKIKNREQKRRVDMIAEYDRVSNLSKQWNPLPTRKSTIGIVDLSSINFVNCTERHFTAGMYINQNIYKVPITYIRWVIANVTLTNTELKLLKSVIN